MLDEDLQSLARRASQGDREALRRFNIAVRRVNGVKYPSGVPADWDSPCVRFYVSNGLDFPELPPVVKCVERWTPMLKDLEPKERLDACAVTLEFEHALMGGMSEDERPFMLKVFWKNELDWFIPEIADARVAGDILKYYFATVRRRFAPKK